MQTLRKISEFAQVALFVLIAFFIYCAFLKSFVEPLAPAITFCVVLFFTLATYVRWTTALLSSVGIAVYVLAWPILTAYGQWPSALATCMGFTLWLTGVYRAFANSSLCAIRT